MNKKMPVVFIGHGSPMNAIDDNEYTKNWKRIAGEIPKPKAILAISAHWYTQGSRIQEDEKPKTVYDMYGFPKELYEIVYNAVGSKELAEKTKELINRTVITDNSWGYDHGTWSVLVHMYPNRDIPVFQLSVDKNALPEVHYQIGKDIKKLREAGVLILGSGNVVHNLSALDWNRKGGYPLAQEFDEYIKNSIKEKRYEDVVQYKKAGEAATLSVPPLAPDHFYPLLYVLGAIDAGDKVTVYNDSCIMGSLSMTSYVFSDYYC